MPADHLQFGNRHAQILDALGQLGGPGLGPRHAPLDVGQARADAIHEG